MIGGMTKKSGAAFEQNGLRCDDEVVEH